MLPTAFSRVNERFHSPHWAVLLVGACYAVLIPLFWLTNWASVYLNTSLVTPVASALPFVAAALFYYKRRDLFSSTLGGGSRIAARLTLLSIVVLILFGIYIFAEIAPLNSGIYLGANVSIAIEAVVALVILGVLMYAISRFRLKRKNIDFVKMYEEIPPE